MKWVEDGIGCHISAPDGRHLARIERYEVSSNGDPRTTKLFFWCKPMGLQCCQLSATDLAQAKHEASNLVRQRLSDLVKLVDQFPRD